MHFEKLVVAAVCTLLASSALAQDEGHVSGKLDPQTLAALHADYARYKELNGIDDSKAPISYDYILRRAANNISLLGVLDVISGHPEILDHLELVDDQQEAVNGILDQYKELKSNLEKDSNGASESIRNSLEFRYQEDCRKLTQELSEVLVDFQSLAIADSTLGSGGLLYALSKPNLASRYVGLSDRQIERLMERQEELGQEIQEFIQKKRQEASEMFEEELTHEQKQRVVEFFGADAVSQSFEYASSESMMVRSGINMQDQFGPKIEAWRDIEKEIQDN